MVLCLCKGLSDKAVQRVIDDGARSVDEIGDRCGAGTDCGSCKDALEQMVESCGRGCADCPRRAATLYSPGQSLGEAA